MKKVCVITGGGSGMGLAAAKYMEKDRILVLSGRTLAKLEKAAGELRALGYETAVKTCDTSVREDVAALADFAAALGEIRQVIHCAGLSPAMADPEKLLRVNALGTVYINTEFAKRMRGGVIVDISSNSAYALPKLIIPLRAYPLAETDEAAFLRKLLGRCRLAPEGYQRSGMAYAMSKHFAVWYAQQCAFAYGRKGIRVCSVSPGLVATDMGNLEKEEGAALLRYTAENRMGTPEELGFAIASAADERNGYLAGVDILCDGGSTNGKK